MVVGAAGRLAPICIALLFLGCVSKKQWETRKVVVATEAGLKPTSEWKLSADVEASELSLLVHPQRESLCVQGRLDTVEDQSVEERTWLPVNLVVILGAPAIGAVYGFAMDEGAGKSDDHSWTKGGAIAGASFGALWLVGSIITAVDRTDVSTRQEFSELGGLTACGNEPIAEQEITVEFGDGPEGMSHPVDHSQLRVVSSQIS